jgi:hypothetical protein
MVVDGQPAPVADVGAVAFDVADRLAIINLFGAYAYTYDENLLDEFRALRLPDGTTVSRDVDTVLKLLAVRKASSRRKTTNVGTR